MGQGRSDKSVRDDVIDELRWDALVDDTQITVEVAGRVVTLAGPVESYARKLAAQEAAHAVAVVRDVINAVDVRPLAETCPTDGEGLQLLDAELLRDPFAASTSFAWRAIVTQTRCGGRCGPDATAGAVAGSPRPARELGCARRAAGVVNHRDDIGASTTASTLQLPGGLDD